MTLKESFWGGRLPLLKPGELDPDQWAFYDEAALGAPSNSTGDVPKIKTIAHRPVGPYNPMLRSPILATSFQALKNSEKKVIRLIKRAREVVILSVGSVWQAAYELYADSYVAHTVGFGEEAIRALRDGQGSEELTNDERLAQRFTLQVLSRHQVGACLFAEIQATFGNKGIVDMLVLISCYQAVCSVLNVFEVPVPG